MTLVSLIFDMSGSNCDSTSFFLGSFVNLVIVPEPDGEGETTVVETKKRARTYMNFPPVFSAIVLVIAAVKVVLPWST
jgi:hypothetical protein